MKIEIEGTREEVLSTMAAIVRDARRKPKKQDDGFLTDHERALLNWVTQGHYIEAIKHHRNQVGAPLKDAKDFVEGLVDRAHLAGRIVRNEHGTGWRWAVPGVSDQASKP